jgi:hypothetical protein
MYGSRTLSALATLGAHSPAVQHYLHWLHLEPTHLLYNTICTGYTWSPLTRPYRPRIVWDGARLGGRNARIDLGREGRGGREGREGREEGGGGGRKREERGG